MAINAKFALNSPTSKKDSAITFYFYNQRKRFKYSLGIDCMVNPELWDSNRMEPLDIRSKINRDIIKEHKERNPNIETQIHNIRSRIKEVERFANSFISMRILNKDTIDFDELRNYLDAQIQPLKRTSKPTEKTDNLLIYLESFIKGMKKGTILITSRNGTGKQYRPTTIKAYQSLLTNLIEYLKLKRRKGILFDQIDTDFYKSFQLFVYGQGFTPNHFGNLIKNLKHVMKRAQLDRLHINESYKLFKKTSNDSDSIALTIAEVQRLYEYRFKPSDKLEKYRDIFLVGIYTAMRFSDYSRLDHTNFKTLGSGQEVVSIKHKKTGREVMIPVKPELKEIMEKYDYQIPQISEQKMNQNIKAVAQVVGFTKTIKVQKHSGGKETTIEKSMHELFTTHTARRTGCTIFYKVGIPTIDIMMLSGHSTEKEFLNYIKIGPEDTALRVAANPYFQKSSPILKKIV